MTAKCRVCGKEFTVLYPQLYVYKRGTGNGVRYFCSYSCSRIFDRKGCEKMKVTLENKKKAVQIAIDSGNPLKYLEECGAKSPSGTWYHIKKDLKAKDPDRYMELPEKYRPADEPKPIDGGEWEKMETPESNRLKVAVIGKRSGTAWASSTMTRSSTASTGGPLRATKSAWPRGRGWS